MQIICGGSMLFDKFGSTVNFVKKDGFTINEKIHSTWNLKAPQIFP